MRQRQKNWDGKIMKRFGFIKSLMKHSLKIFDIVKNVSTRPVWPDFVRNFATWQTLKSFGQTFEGLFSVWQNFVPTLAKKLWILANFSVCKYPNNDNEMFTFFFDKLYKDFRTHDFEEYEFQFLETILSI